MNKYESMIVISSQLPESDAAQENLKVTALIKELGGEILETDDWGKRALSYEIQKMKEGYYYFIQFDAESTAPAEIENRVRIMENVIRYLCVKQEA